MSVQAQGLLGPSPLLGWPAQHPREPARCTRGWALLPPVPGTDLTPAFREAGGGASRLDQRGSKSILAFGLPLGRSGKCRCAEASGDGPAAPDHGCPELVAPERRLCGHYEGLGGQRLLAPKRALLRGHLSGVS